MIGSEPVGTSNDIASKRGFFASFLVNGSEAKEVLYVCMYQGKHREIQEKKYFTL
jgi:hypothetical protein